MSSKQLNDLLIQRVAGAGITSSTTRGQGPSGTMWAALQFLSSPELLASLNEANSASAFIEILNIQTEHLRAALPPGFKKDGRPYGQHWGSARKFLNIFLLDCALNRYLCDSYKNIKTIEPWLEVPLDSYVGSGLAREQENSDSEFPLAWNKIIELSKQDSDRYQTLAQRVAYRMRMTRAHLDLYYLAFKKPVS